MSKPDPIKEFDDQRALSIAALKADQLLRHLSIAWNLASAKHRYTYNFTALGRPIIQLPQDMVAVQEIIWSVRPDLIIETGVAHGGSLMLSAASLALLDVCDSVANGELFDPRTPGRRVLGIDIDIRSHNRAAIDAHPLAGYIELLQGSSVDPDVVRAVESRAEGCGTVLLMLDSNHTHAHVAAELKSYAHLVSPGSFCIVFDTVIEHFPAGYFRDRDWDVGNSPMTAVHEFIASNPDFVIERGISDKLQISVAPDGYLRRIR